mgnify:FL=1
MRDAELIELARAYVALSNAHRPALIAAMFDHHSSYHSAAFGQFDGVQAIIEMMSGFFQRYPDVHWQAQNFRVSGTIVSFDFSMQASEAGTGALLQRSGVESIDFDAQGIIRKLVVRNL